MEATGADTMLFPQVDVEYTEKMVSISNYPLSAALTCARSPLPLKKRGGSSDSRAGPNRHCECCFPPLSSVDCWKTPTPAPKLGSAEVPGCTSAICLFYKRCSCKPSLSSESS